MSSSSLVVHGIEVPISPSEVSPLIWERLSNGSYESKEIRLAPKAAKRGDRILELGAGLGIVTSALAAVPLARVWAFEADPLTVKLAQRVLATNERDNVVLAHGILGAGQPRDFRFYRRRDLWASSLIESQGCYEETIHVPSANVDEFVARHSIDLMVMDIEGAELELLSQATLPGVERIFVELHDFLYGLEGVQTIMMELGRKGYAYDPLGSSGACVLFTRDRSPRVQVADAE